MNPTCQLFFDHDDDGALSLIEVLGALKWLGLPSVEPSDVIAFVRSLSRSAQISYGAFVELLSPPEDEHIEIIEPASNAIAPITASPAASTAAISWSM